LPERDLGYLADMHKYAVRALSHVESTTFDQFISTEVKIDGVIHCLMVIGEAAARVSHEARVELPQFDWRAMTGMRNRLVHDYGHTDYEIVWDVVQNKLPVLRDELAAYLSRMP